MFGGGPIHFGGYGFGRLSTRELSSRAQSDLKQLFIGRMQLFEEQGNSFIPAREDGPANPFQDVLFGQV